MTSVRLCKECGAPLPADAPEGLCPKCLVAAGLMSELSSIPQPTVLVSASQIVGEPAAKPSTATPEVSQPFGGYRIIRPLGKGGMGAVYEAEEIESGRRVALKVLSHSPDSPEARQRFLREGRLAASVNHPNTVYVFGTEEIDGTPVITMELVAGGTLQERVRQKGPMPIGEAVDAILQVIAGLEAAAAGGVLHRDVKPSNCFVDADGTVKVGDFGLSISTLARGETNLTVAGAFLGTPAYSSPEQLRGENLDVRSDIYAVGVTLYYVLTGKTPFAGANVVQLLANVLEKAPESPSTLRPELPKELSKTILRCLAKQSGDRFKDYEDLRQALLPFGSAARTPAALGPRFLAGFIDYFLVSFLVGLAAPILPQWLPRMRALGTRLDTLVILATPLVLLLYFGLSEGLGGGSAGKTTCRVRVVGPAGGFAGFPKALLRAFIFVMLLFLVPDSLRLFIEAKNHTWLNWTIWTMYVLSFGALFSTARRSNGFAGLHDLASNTRVVSVSARASRTGLPTLQEPEPVTGDLVQIGPYHVLCKLSQSDDYELLLGYDTRLLRRVWIWKRPRGEAPLAALRCELHRRGRLRWLTGKRTDSESWDAYEAVSGKPFLNLLGQRQPWTAVRYWLQDLAEELTAGTEDASLPSRLALDRVWITQDGRAKLLDFPAPGAQEPAAYRLIDAPAAPKEPPWPSGLLFLKQLVMSALEGRIITLTEARNRSVKGPLPLYARRFMDALPGFPTGAMLAADLKALLEKPTEVTSGRRRVGLWLSLWLLLIALGVTGLIWSPMLMANVQSEPDIDLLRHLLARVTVLQKATHPVSEAESRERQALEVFIAAHYRERIKDPFVWDHSYVRGLLPGEWQVTATNIVVAHPKPSESEVKTATASLKPFLDQHRPWIPNSMPGSSILRCIRFMFSERWFRFLVLPALIACLLLRGGPILHLTGIAVVTKTGLQVSRARALSRALLTWSPLLCMPLLIPAVGVAWYMLALACIVAAGGVCAFWTPQRALQDRLLGTWLVPK